MAKKWDSLAGAIDTLLQDDERRTAMVWGETAETATPIPTLTPALSS